MKENIKSRFDDVKMPFEFLCDVGETALKNYVLKIDSLLYDGVLVKMSNGMILGIVKTSSEMMIFILEVEI